MSIFPRPLKMIQGIKKIVPFSMTDLIPTFNLGTGTADSTTYLRGDGTWSGVDVGVSQIVAGTNVSISPTGGTGVVTINSTGGGGGGGLQNGTATGTDTYAVSISGVTSYTDGDAYIIRFTNANTTSSTLNINSLGAKNLYRNNDGLLIGGDIWANSEMLCIYSSVDNGFKCIGTSPNSLFAYVTNADSVTLTKGMPVYAFGGTGDRLTVKRAYNTSDTTSAQTVGIVLTSSIAVNQKGIIIINGQLDNLNIFPTSTWADGDAVYLGATAGTVTKTKPYAPNHLVYLGFVTTASNGSAGRMYVRVQNGYELDELHNVDAVNPNNKDSIFYNSSTLLWEHKSISDVLGYTPARPYYRRHTYTAGSPAYDYLGYSPTGVITNYDWTVTTITIQKDGTTTKTTATNQQWTH